jgi:hypothetical protein
LQKEVPEEVAHVAAFFDPYPAGRRIEHSTCDLHHRQLVNFYSYFLTDFSKTTRFHLKPFRIIILPIGGEQPSQLKNPEGI